MKRVNTCFILYFKGCSFQRSSCCPTDAPSVMVNLRHAVAAGCLLTLKDLGDLPPLFHIVAAVNVGTEKFPLQLYNLIFTMQD